MKFKYSNNIHSIGLPNLVKYNIIAKNTTDKFS